MAKIIGPGSLIVDITGYAPHIPVEGETVKGTSVRFGPGGKGNNQMTAAHRAGSEAVLIGRRGNDVLGKIFEEYYAKENMSEKYIVVDQQEETGSALIEIDERDAQNRIIVVLATNESVNRTSVLEAEPDFANCDAVLTQFETSIEAVQTAKELALKYHKPFILNPAPYVVASNSLYNGVDYITPNETEAEQLTGITVNNIEDCRKASAKLIEMGVKNIIITLGVNGAFYTNGENEMIVPALKVDAVETTGAGDAFNGGFATAIAEGMPVDVALKFATCTAAISVTRYGSARSMPYRKEILELMQKAFGIVL